MNREEMPYRDCVGAAVFNRQGLVFIGRRKLDPLSEDGSEITAPWQMPQGGIDKGERPYPAALRELFEETSIRSVEFVAEAPHWIHYDLPDAALGVALQGKYRGQRQRWFAFRFLGEESEIDVECPGDGTMPAEFDAWRWERLDLLPELIVPFKRDAYRQVVGAFAGVPDKTRRLRALPGLSRPP
jgi:putative (di)nucleoside polyphosphate hydrolase